MISPCHRTLLGAATAALLASLASAQVTTRVSVDSQGVEGNGRSGRTNSSGISADGRFVAFESEATNLVPGDVNLDSDVFVHDQLTGQTTCVSVSSAGVMGDEASFDPSISDDGRFVAFLSKSGNLVPGGVQHTTCAYVHDRLTGQTRMASLTSQGGYAGGCTETGISGDGRWVVFGSWAPGVVPGDTNGDDDVFVHDLLQGTTTRVSVDSSGAQSNNSSFFPTISADGRFVCFSSGATNLTPNDLNGYHDAFVHDRLTGVTTMVSVDSQGMQGNSYVNSPVISGNGRFVAFVGNSDNLVPGDTNRTRDVFVHDSVTGETTRPSVSSAGVEANNDSSYPSLSADGRFVAFHSEATNLIANDANSSHDVFVHDRLTFLTTRASIKSGVIGGFGDSLHGTLSATGRYVAFHSYAPNLVSGDTNGMQDVFVRDRAPDLTLIGGCPGLVEFWISGGTPDGPLALLAGQSGSYVKPNQPCQGLTVGLSAPILLGILSADAVGSAQFPANAPPGACGRSVQAVDVATCSATNVIVL